MDEDKVIDGVRTDVPASARSYGWMLGGKDNFAVDRQAMTHIIEQFPPMVDIARQNRQFLYRAVRFLAQEKGIRQFIDMGCGLPTDNNVHQVAAQFVDDARVVYVDIDPIVLAHGRALLADQSSTTVITADMRDPEKVFADPEMTRLIDLSQPIAVLFLSVGHHIVDADDPRAVLQNIIGRAASGSCVAFSQVVSDDPQRGAALSEMILGFGVPWRTRTPAEVDALFPGLDPVEPGLVNLNDWRPQPDQPALEPVPEEIARFVGVSAADRSVYEYGGVLQKP